VQFDASTLSALALPTAALVAGSVPLGGAWRLERADDSALANLRVLVRADGGGDGGGGGEGGGGSGGESGGV